MDDEIIEAEQDEDMRKFLTSIKENQIRFANDTDVKEKCITCTEKSKKKTNVLYAHKYLSHIVRWLSLLVLIHSVYRVSWSIWISRKS